MGRLRAEVVYATPAGVDAVSVTLPEGATLRDAVMASGIPDRHPEVDVSRAAFGVFGLRRDPDAALAEGDRVEIYRRLETDPKEARRRRAKAEARRRRARAAR